MPLMRRLRTIAAKTESTIGTAETLSASDGAFNAYDMEIQGDIAVEDREDPGSFNRRTGAPGARGGTMSFKTDIQWDGTTVSLPAWAETLFPACGWVKSTTTFTPRSEAPGANVKTVTVGYYLDGQIKKLAGAVGNFKIVLESGKVGVIEWEFQGVWQPVEDGALIAPTYPTDELLRYASAITSWQGVDQCVQQSTIDAGNEIILRECASTDAGYISAVIVDRKPTIAINPEAELVATDDRYGDWIAGTEGAVSLALDGPSSSTLTFSAPKGQIMNVQEGERNKLAIDDVEFSLNKNGATKDEELSIVFA